MNFSRNVDAALMGCRRGWACLQYLWRHFNALSTKDQATVKYEASKNGRRPARSSEAEIPDLTIRIGLRSVSALVDLHSYEASKL